MAKKYDLSPQQKLLVHILRSGAIYLDARRLAAWDEAIGCVREGTEKTSTADELLDEIAEVSIYNMYGAFDAPATQQQLIRLVQMCRAKGVEVPLVANIADW